MAITENERRELIGYIEGRMCEEARAGQECVDRKGNDDLIGGRHPGCLEAGRMIGLVRRA